MDELEKKVSEQQEAAADEAAEIQPEASEEKDELTKELEEIRDMFQQELDNAGSEGGEELGELIQELDEVSEEDGGEAVSERKICECCDENPCSENFGEDYPYCDSCRELMKRYPLRLGGIIAVLVMIVAFGLCVYLGVDKLEGSISAMTAQEYYSEGKIFSSIQTARQFTGNEPVDSKRAEKVLIEGYWTAGYINDAAEYIKAVFTESELNLPWNAKYKKMLETSELFLITKEKADVFVAEAFSGKEYDYEKAIKGLDALMETPVEEGSEKTYSKAFISYYKSELMKVNGESAAAQLEVLKSVSEEERENYDWLYLSSLCAAAAKAGEKEEAEAYFEKIKKNNHEDMNAYISMANYYRFLETPDGDAILALCDEAEKNAYSGDNSYYPTLAIGYLINGEGALALDTMQEFMNTNYYTVAHCNLYALCALYCGNTEIYDSMKTMLENNGYTMSEVVEGYKAKKLTIEQAIADERGDI